MSVGPVAAALIGAGGAIVGGGLAAGSTIFGEASRERRAAAREREASQRTTRRAVRLVADELFRSRQILINEKRIASERLFPLDHWEAQREVLAYGLPDSDWDAVRKAYWGLSILRGHTGLDIDLEFWEEIRDAVGAGLEALQGVLASPTPTPSNF